MCNEKSDFDLVMSMPDVEKHIGKWVAVVDHKIVSIGDTMEEVYIEALKKHPGCEPYLVRIPEKIRCKYGQPHPKSRLFPILDIRLKGPTGSIKRPGLIDSGAEKSALSASEAVVLALPTTGKSSKASGIGGIVDTHEVEVNLEVLVDNMSILELRNLQIDVMPAPLSFVILGRDTVFEYFRITFDEREKEFVLEQY